MKSIDIEEAKDDQFALAFARYGRPWKASPAYSRDNSGLDQLWTLFHYYASLQSQAYGANGIVHFDYIENPRFNALATSYNDQELIGLFSGAVHQLYRFWSCFMCDRDVLPHIEDSTREKLDPSVLELIRTNDATSAHWQYPVSEKRNRAANSLALTSCLLLLNHEVGHFARCHPHYLQNLHPAAVYEELPMSPISAKTSQLRRGMEFQADGYAAAVTFMALRATESSLGNFGQVSVDYACSAGALGLFLLIHKHSGFGFSAEGRAHPAPMDRWLVATSTLSQADECKALSPSKSEIERAMLDVGQFWKRHGLGELPELVPAEEGMSHAWKISPATVERVARATVALVRTGGPRKSLVRQRNKGGEAWVGTHGDAIKSMQRRLLSHLLEGMPGRPSVSLQL